MEPTAFFVQLIPLIFANSHCFQCFLPLKVIPPFSVILKTPIDSVLRLACPCFHVHIPTMTSADFCVFSTASFPCTVVTPFRAFHADLPRYHTFLPLHPSASFIMHDPCSYWASTCVAALPSCITSYEISVRQTRDLPVG